MAHTLQNSEYVADIEQVAFVMGTPDLMNLLHETQCHDDPATDFYNLWQYLQCTYNAYLETETTPIVNDCDDSSKAGFTYDAIMQQRAFVLHWVGHLTAKIHNHALATRFPLQATYGVYQEDVAAFLSLVESLREMARFLQHPPTSKHTEMNHEKKREVVSRPSSSTIEQKDKNIPIATHQQKKRQYDSNNSKEVRRSARLAKKRRIHSSQKTSVEDFVRGC